MPASLDHMTTNFDRLTKGLRTGTEKIVDKDASATLKKIFSETKTRVNNEVKAQLKEAGIPVTPESVAAVATQRIWDDTIAAAVAAGVQHEIPGTRGREFRAAARASKSE